LKTKKRNLFDHAIHHRRIYYQIEPGFVKRIPNLKESQPLIVRIRLSIVGMPR